jgi:hypothetical protein
MFVVLGENPRLKVFENMVLSTICGGPQCEEVMEEWIKLHTEKLC